MVPIFLAIVLSDKLLLWIKSSVTEAVRAYTLGPAYTAGKHQIQGSISPGKWADLIMLSRNIFEIEPEEIPSVEIELTVFDGAICNHAGQNGL